MTDETACPFRVIQAYNRHVELIAPLFDAYRVFNGRAPNIERSTQFLAARIGIRDTVVFLAVEGEEPDEKAVGFAVLYPTFDSVLAASIWVLNDIYVAEPARRRGVARALIERGRELVSDTGAKRLSLETEVDNEPSRALYESLGFRRNDAFCIYVLDL